MFNSYVKKPNYSKCFPIRITEESADMFTSTTIDGVPTFNEIWIDAYHDLDKITEAYTETKDFMNLGDYETIAVSNKNTFLDLSSKYFGQSIESVLTDRYGMLMKLLNLNNPAMVVSASSDLSVLANVSGSITVIETLLTQCMDVYDCTNNTQSIPATCGILESLEGAYRVAALRIEDLPVSVRDADLYSMFEGNVTLLYNNTLLGETIIASDEYVTCFSGLKQLSVVIAKHLHVSSLMALLHPAYSFMLPYANCRRWGLIEHMIDLYGYLLEISPDDRGEQYQSKCVFIFESLIDELGSREGELATQIKREYNSDGTLRMKQIDTLAYGTLDLIDIKSPKLYDVYTAYLNETLNKTTLYERVVNDTTYQRQNNYVQQVLRQYQSRYLDFYTPLSILKSDVLKYFNELFRESRIPFATADLMDGLLIVSKAKSYLLDYQLDTASGYTLKVLTNLNRTLQDPEGYPGKRVVDILDILLAEHLRKVQWIEGEMVQNNEYLGQGVAKAVKHLEDYVEGNQLDADYYL